MCIRDSNESARERRIALYKSDHQQQDNYQRHLLVVRPKTSVVNLLSQIYEINLVWTMPICIHHVFFFQWPVASTKDISNIARDRFSLYTEENSSNLTVWYNSNQNGAVTSPVKDASQLAPFLAYTSCTNGSNTALLYDYERVLLTGQFRNMSVHQSPVCCTWRLVLSDRSRLANQHAHTKHSTLSTSCTSESFVFAIEEEEI